MRQLVAVFLVGLMVGMNSLLWLRPHPAPTVPTFQLGAHLLMTGRHTDFPLRGWGDYLRYTAQMTGEGGWVAQVVQINDLDVAKWQAFLDDCYQLGLRPVLRLATHLDAEGQWVVPDPTKHYAKVAQQWSDFFAALHLPDTLWVIIGNEPNSGVEWDGRVDPTAYAHYFVTVAQHLRRLNKPLQLAPAPMDLYAPHSNNLPFPGLTITMMDAGSFWDAMFLAAPRWMDYADFWASHSYPSNTFSNPPWAQSYQVDRLNGAENLPRHDPPAGIYNRGVNGYQWERWYMASQHNVIIPPVLISEFGYRHAYSTVPESRTQVGQAHPISDITAYLEMAIWGNHGRYPDQPNSGWTPLADDPTIIGVIYFGLAGHPQNWGHSNLLRVDEVGNVLGTYPHYDMLVRQNTNAD